MTQEILDTRVSMLWQVIPKCYIGLLGGQSSERRSDGIFGERTTYGCWWMISLDSAVRVSEMVSAESGLGLARNTEDQTAHDGRAKILGGDPSWPWRCRGPAVVHTLRGEKGPVGVEAAEQVLIRDFQDFEQARTYWRK